MPAKPKEHGVSGRRRIRKRPLDFWIQQLEGIGFPEESDFRQKPGCFSFPQSSPNTKLPYTVKYAFGSLHLHKLTF